MQAEPLEFVLEVVDLAPVVEVLELDEEAELFALEARLEVLGLEGLGAVDLVVWGQFPARVLPEFELDLEFV